MNPLSFMILQESKVLGSCSDEVQREFHPCIREKTKESEFSK